MPADLGTKPVGPARLEDLIKVCGLRVPNGHASPDPPRPQVASLKAGQTDVAKLLLVQVSGAEAEPLGLRVNDLQLLWHSFVVGFGLGCGWWVAGRLEAMISRCFRRPHVSMGLRTPRTQPFETTCSPKHVHTVISDYEEILEPGEPVDPFPVQSEGMMRGLSPRTEESLALPQRNQVAWYMLMML